MTLWKLLKGKVWEGAEKLVSNGFPTLTSSKSGAVFRCASTNAIEVVSVRRCVLATQTPVLCWALA